jgi:hypothetical protein
MLQSAEEKQIETQLYAGWGSLYLSILFLSPSYLASRQLPEMRIEWNTAVPPKWGTKEPL